MRNVKWGFALLILMGFSPAKAQIAVDAGLQNDASTTNAQAVVGEQQQVLSGQASTGTVYTVVTPSRKSNTNNSSTTTDTGTVRLQTQPTTYVQASPLVESRADQLRRERHQAEVQTETKIVEKLEESRLKDEQRRAQRLFGDRWASLSQQAPANQQAQPAAPAPAPQAVQTVAPAPAAVTVVGAQNKDDGSIDKDELKDEIASEVKEQVEDEKLATQLDEVKKKPESSSYFIGYAGKSEYPGVSNIKTDFSAGFGFGTEASDDFYIEGSFFYSRSYIDESYWRDYYGLWRQMDQYDFEVAGKYALLDTRVRPIIGGVLAYTLRKYSDPNAYQYYGQYGDANSNAFDFGALLGAEFEVNSKLSLAADFRYMFNLTNNRTSDYLNSYYRYDNSDPIEQMEYYTLTVGAKFKF